jgi:hypothetical protein
MSTLQIPAKSAARYPEQAVERRKGASLEEGDDGQDELLIWRLLPDSNLSDLSVRPKGADRGRWPLLPAGKVKSRFLANLDPAVATQAVIGLLTQLPQRGE